jgi:hypothetical protein
MSPPGNQEEAANEPIEFRVAFLPVLLLSPQSVFLTPGSRRSADLPRHSTAELTSGKKLSKSTNARLEIENWTNRVYPINLGSEFNGSHVSMPSRVTVRLAYHF